MPQRTVTFSGLEEAIQHFEEFEKTLNEKCDLISRKLAEIGLHVASIRYAEAPYAGTKDVEISIDDSGEKGIIKVRASGKATLFIEFGTGILNAEAYEAREHIKNAQDLVMHGQYGNKQGDNPLGWVYEGTFPSQPPAGTFPIGTKKKPKVFTLGEQAHPFMYEGRKEAIANIDKAVKEVFDL